LRLSRSDGERIQQTGICTESLRFGPGSQLNYSLEASSQVTEVETRYGQDCIRILVPLEIARAWAASDEVSLSANPGEGNGPSLLIEKDFQCLHRDEVNTTSDADAFPNPSAADQQGARS
jgi:hypothetical protein